MSNNLINSFIIHSRPYSETSMIFDILTKQKGFVSVLAKGVKQKKDLSILQPSRELLLNFTNANLPILTKYEISDTNNLISTKFMLEVLYFNELIYKFTPRNEPCSSLYKFYKSYIKYIKDTEDSSDIIIVGFEVLFLREIGYEITLDHSLEKDINPEKYYSYNHQAGFKEIENNTSLDISITGVDLLNLIRHKFYLISELNKVRRINRGIINRLVGERKIKSYDILD
ncbi:MAG: DNA repair protein RecO [Gammaproteobacteria bacterium]|nr:DNA repair protein RecO [Gammaproteobacteria bacterium]